MRPEQIKVLGSYADGGVAVIAFVTKSYHADGSVHWEREASPENIDAECAKISAVLPSPIVRWRIVADADIPAERDYRNAWTDTGAGVGHDMPRARALHRDKLRRDREPKLAELDVEYQRADEREDRAEKRRIALAKQALRDITDDPRIDAATTIEALRALREK
jgi:hypothetical protein